ncbi:hypothetical protein GCM10009828_059960 [Actinoplanes couchii]|uniref:Uncharacterized protein n=1 Tax=Actinoplanes couchii TaxID=403638 RepID=A0ABQ3XM83_9ACTN|nr:hypothetical protein Aco03nite_080180 [Actinoplanes couchii]
MNIHGELRNTIAVITAPRGRPPEPRAVVAGWVAALAAGAGFIPLHLVWAAGIPLFADAKRFAAWHAHGGGAYLWIVNGLAVLPVILALALIRPWGLVFPARMSMIRPRTLLPAIRPRTLASLIRPGTLVSLIHPRTLASLIRPGTPASLAGFPQPADEEASRTDGRRNPDTSGQSLPGTNRPCPRRMNEQQPQETNGQWPLRTNGQQAPGTTGKQTSGTTGRQTSGTTGRRPPDTTGQRTSDTAGQQPSGTAGQQGFGIFRVAGWRVFGVGGRPVPRLLLIVPGYALVAALSGYALFAFVLNFVRLGAPEAIFNPWIGVYDIVHFTIWIIALTVAVHSYDVRTRLDNR